MNICVANEWLYFNLWSGEVNGFYRTKNDGTEKIEVK
jgi:hypothetical protein